MTDLELKAVRTKLKLTQEQMAKKLNTSRSNYAGIEQGRYPISAEITSKVQKLMERSEDKKKADAKAQFMAYIMANKSKKM